MVAAIYRKLGRDIWRLKGQVITIALVVASGIASYVAMQSAWSSLSVSREAYEARYRFAELFAHVQRAPLSLIDQLEAVEGVASVVPRIVERVTLPLPGLSDPATGRVISLPAPENAALNSVYLRAGRLPDPAHADEIVLLASFAETHGLVLGASVPAVLNGRLRQLEVVGWGLSPEFILPMAEGDIAPDDERFAIIWMGEESVASLYEMQGAFNDVVFDLQPGATEAATIDAVDVILDPFGSNGAYGRDDQLSSSAVDSEMAQLETFATVVPAIFLAVAAFLLNVVLSRLIQLQRAQIAALKALGYYNREIGLHYLWMMLMIVLIGAFLGIGLGWWLGSSMTELYARFYRFPILIFRLDAAVVVTAIAISAVAAVVGAAGAIRAVVILPPAEAMRPESPGVYRRSLADRLGLSRLISTSVRMVLREVLRKPLRILFSVVAIAMAAGILVVGRFSTDAFKYMMDVQFFHAWREDMTVMLGTTATAQDVEELTRIEGVLDAEGIRAVAARISAGQRERDIPIYFHAQEASLREIFDIERQRHDVPPGGLLVTGALARALHVEVGDTVNVSLLEGQRSQFTVAIVATAEEPFGLNAYLDAETGQRVLGETPLANLALLRIDPLHRASIEARLSDLPAVVSVMQKRRMIDQFNGQMGEMMLAMTLILTALAATIAVGVVYNNARISLSMRSRDLASLRVLGFTRLEIATIFYGELALQIVLAIPLGLLFGRAMSVAIAKSMDPEIFRLPLIVSTETYAFAAVVLAASGLISALLVWKRLNQLDLIGVLKARE